MFFTDVQLEACSHGHYLRAWDPRVWNATDFMPGILSCQKLSPFENGCIVCKNLVIKALTVFESFQNVDNGCLRSLLVRCNTNAHVLVKVFFSVTS